jgi:putative ABC transport system permease protein
MLTNYFRIAWRSFSNNKGFTAINVLGLSIGISVSLVIFMLISYHLSFDKFEDNRSNTYRVVSDFKFQGEEYKNSGVTFPLSDAVHSELANVTATIPFFTWGMEPDVIVPGTGSNEKTFKHEKGFVFADNRFFNLINYTWVAGNKNTAFREPFQAVVVDSYAKKYFPSLAANDMLGKVIVVDDTVRITITGVVKELNHNSDFKFNCFVSLNTLLTKSYKDNYGLDWNNTNGSSQLYVQLNTNSNLSAIEKEIDAVYERHHKREPDDGDLHYKLQKFSDLHFNSDYYIYTEPIVSRSLLYGLFAIAIFLLALGCINFINLTTANASIRAREIGIRKTLGSSRKSLVLQFLSETFLVTTIATIISLLIAPLIVNAFKDLLPANFSFDFSNGTIYALLAGIVICVGFFAGFYPALVLSSFKPVMVLKNQSSIDHNSSRSTWLRKMLTVSQFTIAQFFIIGTLIVAAQLKFTSNKDLGFRKNALITFRTNFRERDVKKADLLKAKIVAIPGVTAITLCNNPPSSESTWSGTFSFKDGKKERKFDVQQKFGDTSYVGVFGLRILAGQNLPESDTVTGYLINETYAHLLGFNQPRDAVGAMIEQDKHQYRVYGVVNDFHQQSLHEKIKPLVIGTRKNVEFNFAVAITTSNTQSWPRIIASMGKWYKSIYPKDDFDYQFFDEQIAKYYIAEQRTAKLLGWVSGIAVFISCLGLLGLAVFTIRRRTKEIGVRKVLGATLFNLVSLITIDFVKLIAIAFVVSVPIAWLGATKWLESFAYRTPLHWWVFILGGVFMIVIALITLLTQTLKAATANPVNSLRSE